MALASSSSAQMRYIEETSFGVQPGSGNPTNLRMTGETLAYDITTEASKEINSSRQVRDTTQVSANCGGGINMEFAYREYDPFLASLLSNTFTVFGTDGVGTSIPTSCTFNSGGAEGGTITAGGATSGSSIWTALALGQWFYLQGSSISAQNTYFKVSETTSPTTTVITVSTGTPLTAAMDGDGGSACFISTSRLVDGATVSNIKSYRLENQLADVGQFFAYAGMTPSKLSLQFASAAIVNGTIDFMGKESEQDSSSTYNDGIASAVASQSFGLMNAVTGVGQLLINDTPLANTFIKSIGLEVDAKLRAQDGIGYLGAVGLGTGQYAISGNLEIYLYDGSLYQTAIQDNPVSLSFRTVDTSGNGYAFTLPRLKLGVPKVNAGSLDTDVMLGFEFNATRATSGGLANQLIGIDRFGAARE